MSWLTSDSRYIRLSRHSEQSNSPPAAFAYGSIRYTFTMLRYESCLEPPCALKRCGYSACSVAEQTVIVGYGTQGKGKKMIKERSSVCHAESSGPGVRSMVRHDLG